MDWSRFTVTTPIPRLLKRGLLYPILWFTKDTNDNTTLLAKAELCLLERLSVEKK